MQQSKEKKKKLFPFLAYVLTRQTDPEFQTLYDKIAIDPTLYRQAQSIEDWSALIQSNETDAKIIATVAEKLTDEEWNQLEIKYEQSQNDGAVAMASKGAKLKTLKNQKGGNVHIPDPGQLKKVQKRNTGVQDNKDGKPVDAVTKSISRPITMGKEGVKTKKKKKCSCGCDMILTKATGGKVIETCSCKCGGKLKKK